MSKDKAPTKPGPPILVEFIFRNGFKVEFNESDVIVSFPNRTKLAIDNPWTSQGSEVCDAVHGRKYRPNVSDALHAIAQAKGKSVA